MIEEFVRRDESIEVVRQCLKKCRKSDKRMRGKVEVYLLVLK